MVAKTMEEPRGFPMEPLLMPTIIDKYVGESNEDGEPEGQGTAFFKGGHKYQGDFVKGRMHGQGCYEWVDKIVYRGEFNNNKAQGLGTFVFLEEDAEYYGQVFGGRKHGEGTLSFKNLPTKYSGEWCRGCRHGKGKLTFDEAGTSYYEGMWNMGVREGNGRMQYSSGNYYEGQWEQDYKSGVGTMHWVTGQQMYHGTWKHGHPNGKGEHVWLKGSHNVSMTIPDSPANDNTQFQMCNRYKGMFKDGNRNGEGTFFYATGASYHGNWEENVKSGWGAFTFEDGTVFEGKFENDRPVSSDEEVLQKVRNGIIAAPVTPVTINIDDLLEEEPDRDKSLRQVSNLLLRYNTELKSVYRYYSLQKGGSLPNLASNTFMMNIAQFWRFVRDCNMISKDFTLSRVNSIVLQAKQNEEGLEFGHFNPKSMLLFREFVEGIVRVAHYQYHDLPALERRVHHHIQNNVLPNAGKVPMNDFRKTLESDEAIAFVSKHEKAIHKIFNYAAGTIFTPDSPYTDTVSGREFLKMLKDCGAIGDRLSLRTALSVFCTANFPGDSLTEEDKEDGATIPSQSQDDFHALQTELIFPEFWETLCKCALTWKTNGINAANAEEGTEEHVEVELLDAITEFLETVIFPYAPAKVDLGPEYPRIVPPEPQKEPSDIPVPPSNTETPEVPAEA